MKHLKKFNEREIKDRSEMPEQKRQIDLSGPDGNAFVILGIAQDLCRQLKDINPERYDWDKIKTEMESGDYENLINVFDNYFGDFVDLYR